MFEQVTLPTIVPNSPLTAYSTKPGICSLSRFRASPSRSVSPVLENLEISRFPGLGLSWGALLTRFTKTWDAVRELGSTPTRIVGRERVHESGIISAR